jgi:hypothetical protein
MELCLTEVFCFYLVGKLGVAELLENFIVDRGIILECIL